MGGKRFRVQSCWEVLVLAPFDIVCTLYNEKKKICSIYKVHGTQNDRLALTVSTQKSDFEKYGMVPEILAKTLQNMQVWFCDLDFVTFWLISWDPVHIFQNQFLR